MEISRTEFARLSSLVAQLQGALGGNRFLRGEVVGATGAITAGTGFSVVRGSAGSYTVTFDTAFADVPTVVPGAVASAESFIRTGNPTAAGFVVVTENSAGTPADLAGWSFVAAGPA